VALTFDDGPYAYTSQLLNILSQNNVRATFFINGQNWGPDITTDANSRALIQRMINEGHQVASHTWSHQDLSTLSATDQRLEMTRLETALLGIIGRYPTYMRPPYFSCSAQCLNTMNSLSYHVVRTDIDTLDWQYNTPSTIQTSMNIFRNALNNGASSYLPLAHDVHSTTVNYLVSDMIIALRARGLSTVTVGECMNDPAANWYRTTQ